MNMRTRPEEAQLDSKRSKVTTVEVETRVARRAGTTTELSREEELVVRMSRGLSEGPDFALTFRGQDHEETSARLALMEADLLDAMGHSGPLDTAAAVDGALKSRIMERLASLD
ncbi:MAG: hypothetical protein ACI81R_001350 [Bradymonadia bacterium]|jgi:hypothetical protein